MARKQNGKPNGRVFVHRLFGEAFYENLGAMLDDQIAEMMKDPKVRAMVDDFSVRMFETMTEIARKHMEARK